MTMPPRPTIAPNKFIAAMLLAIVMGVFVAISHHPVATASEFPDKLASIREQALLDQWVHGFIMFLLLLLSASMKIFSDRLSLNALAVLTARTSYFYGAVFMLIAMSFDGFIVPAIAVRCIPGVASCAENLDQTFILISQIVQVFTRLGFIAIAFAILFWSIQLLFLTKQRISGLIGMASALLQLMLLATIAAQLTPHSMLFVLSGQMIWYGIVANSFWISDGQNVPISGD